ncbi:hypothetical protein EYF80_041156 [Liparis tanakae]|uniref:Uncharacterized protein n=1 Tax=Liparis tanakae TaxID=230148 RepID=A0A4Z2G4Z9_9TELE|nr:hypothetical protein EYF80_041156 [Liparis tanakae]
MPESDSQSRTRWNGSRKNSSLPMILWKFLRMVLAAPWASRSKVYMWARLWTATQLDKFNFSIRNSPQKCFSCANRNLCEHDVAIRHTSCTLAVVTRICPVYMNWMMPSTVSGSGPVAELHSFSSTRPDRDSENCPPSSSVKYSEPADSTERWADKVCTLSPPELNTSVTSQYSPDFLCSFCLRESSEQWVEQVNSSASSGSPSPVSARCAPLLRSSGASAAAADIPRRGRCSRVSGTDDGEQAGGEARDEVLASTSTDDGVVRTGDGRPVIRSHHQAHLDELAGVSRQPKQQHSTADAAESRAARRPRVSIRTCVGTKANPALLLGPSPL